MANQNDEMTFDFGDDFVLPEPTIIRNTNTEDDEEDKKDQEPGVEETETIKETDSNDEEETGEEESESESESEEGEGEDEVEEYVQNHFKFMQEEGYVNLPEDYEFKGDLYDVYRLDAENRQKAAVESLITAVDDSAKDVLNYILQGGSNINDMLAFAQQADTLDAINIDSEEDAESYALYHLQNNKGLDEDIAKSVIESMKDKGVLEETAKKYYEADLVVISKQKEQLISDQIKAQEDAKAQQQKYLVDLDESLKSRDWEPSAKQRIKREIYGNNTVAKLQHIIASDPNTFLELARILSAYDPKKGLVEVIDKKEKAVAGKKVKRDFFQKAASKKTHSSKGRGRKKKIDDLILNYDDIDINTQ